MVRIGDGWVAPTKFGDSRRLASDDGKDRSVLSSTKPGYDLWRLRGFQSQRSARAGWAPCPAPGHRRGPWRSFEAVEFATLEWVAWFNNWRLLEPIGNIPPAEAEARYHAQTEGLAMVA
jgi:transposase InsO family protein